MSSSNDDPPAKRTRSALKTLKRPSPMPSSAPTNENDNKHLHDEIERLTEELIEEKRANMKIFETSLKISNAVQGILEMTVSVTLQAAKDLDQRLNNIERKMDMAARMEESIRNESIQKDVEKKIEETLAKERENTAFYRGKMCELMKQMQNEQVAVGGPTPWKHCELCNIQFTNSCNKLPIILVGCGHTMCKSCVQKQWKDGTIKCPFDDECNETIVSDVDSLPTNKHILHA